MIPYRGSRQENKIYAEKRSSVRKKRPEEESKKSQGDEEFEQVSVVGFRFCKQYKTIDLIIAKVYLTKLSKRNNFPWKLEIEEK